MFAQRWSSNRKHKAKEVKSQSPVVGREWAGVVKALVRPRALGWDGSLAHMEDQFPLWAMAQWLFAN